MEGITATDWTRSMSNRGLFSLFERREEDRPPDKEEPLIEKNEERESLPPLGDKNTYSNFIKDYNRMMIVDHTEVEFIYSVCRRCGRKYITGMLLLGEKGSPGREGPPLDGCSQCEG